MNKYIKNYLSKACSADLQPLFINSNNITKEITESYAAFTHMNEIIYKQVEDGNTLNLCIGDGALAMTGAMLAFMTKSVSVSVDPLINENRLQIWMKEKSVQLFYYQKSSIQDFEKTNSFRKMSKVYKHINLICVHAHVDLKEMVKLFPSWEYIYTNPCCNYQQQTLDIKFQKENNISVVKAGRDTEILSPMNEIFVYKNNKR